MDATSFRSELRDKFSSFVPDEIERFEGELAKGMRPQSFGVAAFKAGLLFGGMIGSADVAKVFFEYVERFFSCCEDISIYDGARATQERRTTAAVEASLASFSSAALLRQEIRHETLAVAEVTLREIILPGVAARTPLSGSASSYMLQWLALSNIRMMLGLAPPHPDSETLTAPVIEPWEELRISLSDLLISGARAPSDRYTVTYCHLFNSANYDTSLVAGMSIVPVYLLSLVRSAGNVERAIEGILCD